jgi:hypothetical protein
MTENIKGTNTTTRAAYNTLIPSLSDNADIVSALKIYHYGSDVDSEVPTTQSIASYLDKTVDKTLIGTKGDLFVGTANDTPGILSLITGVDYKNGQYLATSTTSSTGLIWKDPEALQNEIYLLMGVF